MDRIREIEKNYLRKQVPEFRIGDVVDVQLRIKDGEKERIQTFSGTVIARKGGGLRETFTVRRIVAGEGVERVFPVHTPTIANVIVRRPGQARRAKLYYLRDRVGKATKTRERREEDTSITSADLLAPVERKPAAAAAPASPAPEKKPEKKHAPQEAKAGKEAKAAKGAKGAPAKA